MVTTASWYHCSVKAISRSSGRTAIAAAAYRSGGRLHDDQLDKTYDYTRRRGVETSFIVAPEAAPEWAYHLESLWNHAQAKDNRKNSCMAREVELALPNSLDVTDRETLTREFALYLVERYGVAVSVALHEPSRHGDDRNYHAHIMMTTRRIDENGFGQKTRELDDLKTGPHEVVHLREYAATLINEYLEDAGQDERVDHRSFADRGINQEPTRHLGVEATAMERRGDESRIGDQNREIEAHNAGLDDLVSELASLDAEIAAEKEERFLPSDQSEEQESHATEIQIGDAAEQPALTWEEQKRIAQRVFHEQDLAAETEANPIDQAGPLALTWEEQKATAQSAFKAFDGIRNALRLSPSVRAEIDKIRDVLSSVTGQQEKFEDPQQPFAVEEHAPLDLFSSPIVLAFESDIKERGEITEHGIGRSWIARTGAMFENFYYGTMERIRDTWQKYVGHYTYQSQDRDIESDR